MNREQLVEDYYHSSEGVRLQELTRLSRNNQIVVQSSTPDLRHEEELDPHDIDEAMDEVSKSLRVLEYGENYFEIALANQDATNGELMLHMSTYSSSISTNHGNGYEFAVQAVRYPNHRHLYIASFGNGSTTPLTKDDRQYVRSTGRFIKGTADRPQPLTSIRNLNLALSQNDLEITSIIGTDSAGGHYARALAVEMEKDQLSHAFFSETSGFVDLSIARTIGGMLIAENIVNSRANHEISPDPEKLDADKINRFKEAYEKHADIPQRKELEKHKVGALEKAVSLYTSLQALRRGPRDDSSPLRDDTNALLARHPNAKVTHGMAENDPLYLSPEQCRSAAILFLRKITAQNAEVSVIIVPGMTHAYNTHFPSLYYAVKKYALELY